MATCGPADTLLLARNCHISAFSGMVMAGCRPCYVQPGAPIRYVVNMHVGMLHQFDASCAGEVASTAAGSACVRSMNLERNDERYIATNKQL